MFDGKNAQKGICEIYSTDHKVSTVQHIPIGASLSNHGVCKLRPIQKFDVPHFLGRHHLYAQSKLGNCN